MNPLTDLNHTLLEAFMQEFSISKVRWILATKSLILLEGDGSYYSTKFQTPLFDSYLQDFIDELWDSRTGDFEL